MAPVLLPGRTPRTGQSEGQCVHFLARFGWHSRYTGLPALVAKAEPALRGFATVRPERRFGPPPVPRRRPAPDRAERLSHHRPIVGSDDLVCPGFRSTLPLV